MGKFNQNEPFDKYYYYSSSVQSPESDVSFMQQTYREICSKEPKTLREDFCGTFAICCEWVKLNENHRAYGIDNDPEPLNYGKSNYLNRLLNDAQERIELAQIDVLSGELPSVDVACALNFSYFCFKQRDQLKKYFENVHHSLNESGIFILDCFGGSKCYEANEEETEDEEKEFSYFWDQDEFDPVSNYCKFHIHFQRKGEPKRRNVFNYDWRLWSIPELRELLAEAGFKKTYVYWEGDDDEGEGNGEFSRVEVGEECESWIAYIAAAK